MPTKFYGFVFSRTGIIFWCYLLVCSLWIDIWVLLDKTRILTPAAQILQSQMSVYLTD